MVGAPMQAAQGSSKYIMVCSFDMFKSGSARSNYTSRIKSKVTGIISAASSYSTDYEKVKYFHDTICNTVTYKVDSFISGDLLLCLQRFRLP